MKRNNIFDSWDHYLTKANRGLKKSIFKTPDTTQYIHTQKKHRRFNRIIKTASKEFIKEFNQKKII